MVELTHNWDTKKYDRGDAYGHVAYEVMSIADITPSGKTTMAFVDDPDGYEIELLEQ